MTITVSIYVYIYLYVYVYSILFYSLFPLYPILHRPSHHIPTSL